LGRLYLSVYLPLEMTDATFQDLFFGLLIQKPNPNCYTLTEEYHKSLEQNFGVTAKRIPSVL
jgi:hypothetical protein